MKKIIIGFAVILVIGLIAAIAIPNIMKSRQYSRKSSCRGRLRQLDAAKEQAAIEMKLAEGSIVSTSDVDRFIKGGTQLEICPSDPKHSFTTSYSLEPIGSKPRCLINPGSHHL